MKNTILLITFILVSHLVLAQRYTIKGNVVDTVSSPMPYATVVLLQAKDSTLVNFGVTNTKGAFELKNIASGNYHLKVTFVGFATFTKNLSSSDFSSPVVDLQVLKMQSSSQILNEVTVVGEAVPVTMKRDTIEYNASSFKTKANGTVEDMLKKMPGIEVQTDGSIKAQGEQVQRVMVDGHEFFGRDPKLATRNLPADAINKVQVYDKKSDQSVFTGIDDGQTEKTINLQLKESKRNGAFGNVVGGVGSNDRWQGRANINRFAKGQQLSFLGMGNNVNDQGFSLDDYMNFSGGSQQVGGGSIRVQLGADNPSGVPLNFGGRQNGITTNYAGGVNFNRDYGTKTKLTSSYFYNRLDQSLIQQLHRVNTLANDSSYYFDQQSRQHSVSDNHRINFALDHQLDSANSIKFTTAVTYTTQDQNLGSTGRTTLTDSTLRNESQRLTLSNANNINLNSSLLYRHRFAKKGRTISTNFTLGLAGTNADGSLQSNNVYYDEVVTNQNINQVNNQKNQSEAYGVTVSYTEPLGNRKYLEFNYNFRNSLNQVNKDVYNQRDNQNKLDSLLSNKYHSTYIYNKPGVNFRINRPKFNLAVGVNYQLTNLRGDLVYKEVNINRTFKTVLPVTRLNYDFASTRHLRFEYEASMKEPTIQQLSPVIDNSDPLNISEGNPNIKPAYAHAFRLNYTQFDPSRFIGFFGFINSTYTTNAISTEQDVNTETLARTSKPVNVKDNFTVSGNFNLGFPVAKLNSRFSVGPSSGYTKAINLLNGLDNISKQYTWGGIVRYDYTLKEILTLGLSMNVSQQTTSYSFRTQNQRYLNETYSTDANLNFLKNYSFNTAFDFYRYVSQTSNFEQSIPLLNLSISRFLLKAKSGEFKVGVMNVLDKSMSVSQTTSVNYLQQTTSNNLGRYFMVSFTYALNKQLNPMGGEHRRGGPGGPPMRMMIRD
ncbi:MAG TPA: TonB-dependent receptor [Cyclobacteriaceae bacterium]